ncbi:MAG: radical SAM protein [Bacteroidetes bacterium HGW-Bacteroidetes-22]|nr:MAG: radical SAM protein [Bacteroidetes bacterium HGW-Bacteroidetes-22]
MSTFLFSDIIFGPVKSRRFGVSLGINLLPCDRKLCSFNCIYCECGWTTKNSSKTGNGWVDALTVETMLEERLQEMKLRDELPDTITFAGNGEPTLHPQFLPIMKATIALRGKYAPDAVVAVLSNASTAHRPDVFEALMLADSHVMKLDTGTEETYKQINQPASATPFAKILSNLMLFNGDLTIQTMFLKGNHDGHAIDNTTEKEIKRWLDYLIQIKPQLVMIYSIARDTPAGDLMIVEKKQLNIIARQVEKAGIKAEVF